MVDELVPEVGDGLLELLAVVFAIGLGARGVDSLDEADDAEELGVLVAVADQLVVNLEERVRKIRVKLNQHHGLL